MKVMVQVQKACNLQVVTRLHLESHMKVHLVSLDQAQSAVARSNQAEMEWVLRSGSQYRNRWSQHRM